MWHTDEKCGIMSVYDETGYKNDDGIAMMFGKREGEVYLIR